MTHIQLRQQRSNQRVLPVFYDDNYVSLLPGESRTIQVEAASRTSAARIPSSSWTAGIQSSRAPASAAA